MLKKKNTLHLYSRNFFHFENEYTVREGFIELYLCEMNFTFGYVLK